MAAIQIDCTQIPKAEMKNICKVVITAAKRFYDDPDNCKKFEAWKAARAAVKNQIA